MAEFSEQSIIDSVNAVWLDPTPGDPDNDVPPTPGRYVINVRRADRVLRVGRKAGDRDTTTDVIASVLHRHVLELTTTDEKGQTVPVDLSDQDPIVQKIAAAVAEHVEEVSPLSPDQVGAKPPAR